MNGSQTLPCALSLESINVKGLYLSNITLINDIQGLMSHLVHHNEGDCLLLLTSYNLSDHLSPVNNEHLF